MRRNSISNSLYNCISKRRQKCETEDRRSNQLVAVRMRVDVLSGSLETIGNTPNCLSSGCERASTILDNDFRTKIS